MTALEPGSMIPTNSTLNDAATDESAVTDIEIAPDGRLFLFGASREVLALLVDIGLARQGLQSHVMDRLPAPATSSIQDYR